MTPEDQEAINDDVSRISTARKYYTRVNFDCPTCKEPAGRACRTASGARCDSWHAARRDAAEASAGWPHPGW